MDDPLNGSTSSWFYQLQKKVSWCTMIILCKVDQQTVNQFHPELHLVELSLGKGTQIVTKTTALLLWTNWPYGTALCQRPKWVKSIICMLGNLALLSENENFGNPTPQMPGIYFSDIIKQLNVLLNHHHFYLIRSFHLYSFSFIFTLHFDSIRSFMKLIISLNQKY